MNKTAIAAINVTFHISKAYIVHHLSSVFTAEVLALDLGIQSFVYSGKYLILTENKSSLAALKNINHKSPTCTLHLYHSHQQADHHYYSITPFFGFQDMSVYKLINFLIAWPKTALLLPQYTAVSLWKTWKNTSTTHSHNALSSRGTTANIMRIVLTLVPFNYQNIQSHYEAILTAWFRAESLPVEYWLLKCKIRYSPTCSFCSADDGSEVHYLFYCRTSARWAWLSFPNYVVWL